MPIMYYHCRYKGQFIDRNRQSFLITSLTNPPFPNPSSGLERANQFLSTHAVKTRFYVHCISQLITGAFQNYLWINSPLLADKIMPEGFTLSMNMKLSWQ
jgi:hypothetical protein